MVIVEGLLKSTWLGIATVDHGCDPAGVKRALRELPTFAEVAEGWVANRVLDPNHNVLPSAE
jgi:hypothetical protein